MFELITIELEILGYLLASSDSKKHQRMGYMLLRLARAADYASFLDGLIF